ncbi:MAG: 3-isopropylmalate dehydratase small subunit [Chloroflexota bacterium]|nr:3-isopropylmalate dehydratase small subunit [Chloroflexota bacterium]
MSVPFQAFRSAVLPLLRDDVDTDQIIPARFLKAVDRDGMGVGLFADWRYDRLGAPRPEFVLNDPSMEGRRILLAGANFGCGSSREHAAWALAAWGIRAVIAPSFADIFRANALKNGLLPIALDPPALTAVERMVSADPSAELGVDLEARTVELNNGETLPFDVDPFSRSMLLAGTDELGYLLSFDERISTFDDRLADLRPSTLPT